MVWAATGYCVCYFCEAFDFACSSYGEKAWRFFLRATVGHFVLGFDVGRPEAYEQQEWTGVGVKANDWVEWAS